MNPVDSSPDLERRARSRSFRCYRFSEFPAAEKMRPCFEALRADRLGFASRRRVLEIDGVTKSELTERLKGGT
jgi:hypothetical protein